MQKKPTRFCAVPIFSVAAMVLLFTGGPLGAQTLDQLYEAAKAEGTVSLLSAPNTVMRNEIVNAFAARFPGIKLEYTGMGAGPIATKVTSEARGGVHSTDVLITGTTAPLTTLKDQNLTRSLDPEIVVPDARAPSKWMDGGLAWADKEKTNLAMTLVILTPVITNNDLVPPGTITRDKDLLDPRWKGKIVTNNPGIPGAAGILYRYYYDRYGPEFIRALKGQEVTVTNDLRQIVDWVAKGRYPIGLGASGQSISFFLEKGVKNLGVKDGAAWKDDLIETPGFGSLVMLRNAPHPNAARLFVNWLLTKEGQTALVNGLKYPSRRLDVSQEPVPEFLRSTPGRKYIAGWDEAFVKSPNTKKLRALLEEIKFSQAQ